MKSKTWLLATALAFACAAPAFAADQIGYGASSTNPNTVPVTPQTPLPVTGTINASTTCTASTSAPTYTAGANPLSCDLAGNLRIGGTISASSSTTATAAAPSYTEGSSTNAFSVNLTGDLRTIAKQSGAWTVGLSGTLPAFGSTPTFNIGTMPSAAVTNAGTFAVQATEQASTTGGVNTKSVQAANNTTSIAVCAAACTLYGLYVQNNSGTIAYAKLYDAAQGSTTCGSGTPKDRFMIPANSSGGGGAVIPVAAGFGAAYGTALSLCITTGIADTDTSAPVLNTYQVSLYTK